MQECKNFCPYQIDRSIAVFTNHPYIRDIPNGLVIESTDRDYLRRVWGRFVNCTTNPVSNYDQPQ